MSKLIITFKDPDAISSARFPDASEQETTALNDAIEKFFAFGEYVHIELDTETGEVRVVPIDEDC